MGRYQIEFDKIKHMFSYLNGKQQEDELESVHKQLMQKVD
jgi:hypothetical protein